MLRKVSNAFGLSFERGGGSIIIAGLDVWQPMQNQWRLVRQFQFNHALQPREDLRGELEAGAYTCIFQCLVRESLNGRYEFVFEVDGNRTYVDSGDVNTTAASNDSKVFKDQFVLQVGAA